MTFSLVIVLIIEIIYVPDSTFKSKSVIPFCIDTIELKTSFPVMSITITFRFPSSIPWAEIKTFPVVGFG